MQLSANQIEEENQLFWLLRVTRVSMKRLSKHTLITKADWEMLDLAWHAAHANDVAAFEKAINDLDSCIHFHSHRILGQEGAAQYRLVRSLIHCIQNVWAGFFQAH